MQSQLKIAGKIPAIFNDYELPMTEVIGFPLNNFCRS